MKFATSLATISQLALGVLALVARNNQSEINYYIPTWDIQVYPGAPTVAFKGTVQEVHTQLLKLDPNYEADFAHLYSYNRTAMEKRTDFT